MPLATWACITGASPAPLLAALVLLWHAGSAAMQAGPLAASAAAALHLLKAAWLVALALLAWRVQQHDAFAALLTALADAGLRRASRSASSPALASSACGVSDRSGDSDSSHARLRRHSALSAARAQQQAEPACAPPALGQGGARPPVSPSDAAPACRRHVSTRKGVGPRNAWAPGRPQQPAPGAGSGGRDDDGYTHHSPAPGEAGSTAGDGDGDAGAGAGHGSGAGAGSSAGGARSAAVAACPGSGGGGRDDSDEDGSDRRPLHALAKSHSLDTTAQPGQGQAGSSDGAAAGGAQPPGPDGAASRDDSGAAAAAMPGAAPPADAAAAAGPHPDALVGGVDAAVAPAAAPAARTTGPWRLLSPFAAAASPFSSSSSASSAGSAGGSAGSSGSGPRWRLGRRRQANGAAAAAALLPQQPAARTTGTSSPADRAATSLDAPAAWAGPQLEPGSTTAAPAATAAEPSVGAAEPAAAAAGTEPAAPPVTGPWRLRSPFAGAPLPAFSATDAAVDEAADAAAAACAAPAGAAAAAAAAAAQPRAAAAGQPAPAATPASSAAAGMPPLPPAAGSPPRHRKSERRARRLSARHAELQVASASGTTGPWALRSPFAAAAAAPSDAGGGDAQARTGSGGSGGAAVQPSTPVVSEPDPAAAAFVELTSSGSTYAAPAGTASPSSMFSASTQAHGAGAGLAGSSPACSSSVQASTDFSVPSRGLTLDSSRVGRTASCSTGRLLDLASMELQVSGSLLPPEDALSPDASDAAWLLSGSQALPPAVASPPAGSALEPPPAAAAGASAPASAGQPQPARLRGAAHARPVHDSAHSHHKLQAPAASGPASAKAQAHAPAAATLVVPAALAAHTPAAGGVMVPGMPAAVVLPMPAVVPAAAAAAGAPGAAAPTPAVPQAAAVVAAPAVAPSAAPPPPAAPLLVPAPAAQAPAAALGVAAAAESATPPQAPAPRPVPASVPPPALSCMCAYPACLTEGLATEVQLYVLGLEQLRAQWPPGSAQTFRVAAFYGSTLVADVHELCLGGERLFRVPLPGLPKGLLQLAVMLRGHTCFTQSVLILPAPCAQEMAVLWASQLQARVAAAAPDTPMGGESGGGSGWTSQGSTASSSSVGSHGSAVQSAAGSAGSGCAAAAAATGAAAAAAGRAQEPGSISPLQVQAVWQRQFQPVTADIAYLLTASRMQPAARALAGLGGAPAAAAASAAASGTAAAAPPAATAAAVAGSGVPLTPLKQPSASASAAAARASAAVAAATLVSLEQPQLRSLVTHLVQFLAAHSMWAVLQLITDSVYGVGASARALYASRASTSSASGSSRTGSNAATPVAAPSPAGSGAAEVEPPAQPQPQPPAGARAALAAARATVAAGGQVELADVCLLLLLVLCSAVWRQLLRLRRTAAGIARGMAAAVPASEAAGPLATLLGWGAAVAVTLAAAACALLGGARRA